MNKSTRKILIIGAALFSCSAVAAPETLNICTGGEGGFYQDLGTQIGTNTVKRTDITLNVLNTGGSVDNASLLKAGKCDMAIMQADAVITQPLPSNVKVVDAHQETIFWLHGKNSPVDDFDMMEDDDTAKKYAFATVTGSGAGVTLQHWISTDEDYKGAVPVEFDNWYEAAEAVAQGYTKVANVTVEIAGMLYISRPGKIASDITADYSDQILVGEVSDSSFGNAKDVNDNPLYTECSVSSKETNGLKTSTFGSADTYCVRAQVVYNTAWHEGDKALAKAVYKGINGVVKAVR